jgi:hypothetical protein
MKIGTHISAAAMIALCGQALAQPVLDGSLAGDESLYGAIKWVQNVPTQFGDNNTGDTIPGGSGDVGDPENVTTGIELVIPRAALNNATSFRMTGWVNSGDRGFLSNQTIHDGSMPTDTDNIGGTPDFSAGFATNDFVTVDLGTAASGSATIDGSSAGDSYTQVFLQTNFTGFGDNGDATEIGGSGSEIDAVYVASDATNVYLFIAGNLEANGNGLDLYFDTDNGATGLGTLDSSSTGDGGFITDAQDGLVFETGFAADFVVSVDSIDDEGNRLPRAFAGPVGGSIDDLGTIPGYGAANGGELASGYSMAIDNSNTAGVIGSPVDEPDTPAAPNLDWAYGSEINGVYAHIDETNNRLWVLVTGNMEVNRNRLHLFFDVQDGGQNELRADNIDISFNGLNAMAGLTFDEGFGADYWLNFNTNIDPNLVNFTDSAVLRTNGPLLDTFSGLTLDYGAFFGGSISERDGTATDPRVKTMDFSGDRVDIQDGFTPSLFTNYAPRLTTMDPNNPVAGLLQVFLDNSNVAGVTDSDASGAGAVTTGLEISIDLDELGWDGTSDIRMSGYISNADFNFISNQVIGGLPDGSANLEAVDAVDFSMIDGDQFVNLSAGGVVCQADFNGDGNINILDVVAFINNWNVQGPGSDFNNDGNINILDVVGFINTWNLGCP